LLGDTPLVLLLSAESARLSGDSAQAQAAFTQLTAHKDMAFLGHRGLLRHRLAEGDHAAAQTHALAAEDAYPGSAWLRGKRLELAVKQQNWPAALALTQAPAQVAALATAASDAAADKRQALAYAKQAVKADPSLAPAVVAFAQALRNAGKPRAAARALLAGWKTAPNPLIAEAYLAAYPTPIERAQAASELAVARPDHLETELVLGETALAARLTGEARRHAEAVVTAGDKDGRGQNILAMLDGKPATLHLEAGWNCTACHTAHAQWAPACPQCGAVGGLQWEKK
jgi:HemY protein